MRIRTIRSLICAAVMAAVCASPAAAQDPGVRGFIGGLGGVTFGTSKSSGMAGVQGGFAIAPEWFVIGEFGRFGDVLPNELADEVDLLETLVELELGVPVSFEVTAPATYGFGGVRWARGMGRITPFVEAGIGVAKGTVEFGEVRVGGIDVTDLLNDILEDEGVETSATDFLWTLGGGISAALTDTVAADVGYRFTRIATDDPNVNVNTLYGALKILFR